MTSHAYTRLEIDTYIESNLHFAGDIVQRDHASIRQRFTETFLSMPAYQQTLMIENNVTSIACSDEEIAKKLRHEAYPETRDDNRNIGGFNSGDLIPVQRLKKYFNDAALHEVDYFKSPVVWSVGDPNTERTIIHHEIGHNADRWANPERGQIFSETPEWNEALKKEMQVSHGNKALPYEGPIPLEDLFASYDSADHPIEAFAELTAHYQTAYGHFKGDETKTSTLMSEHYPHLWAIYKDKAIPELKKHADGLQNERTKKIESYIGHSKKLAAHKGEAFDEIATQKNASLLSLRGTIERDTLKIERDVRMHDMPLPFYVDARQQIFRQERMRNLRKHMQEKIKFDPEAIKHEGMKCLEQSGNIKFVEKIKDLEKTAAQLSTSLGRPSGIKNLTTAAS